MTFEYRVDGRVVVWDITDVVEPTPEETAELLAEFSAVTSSLDPFGAVFELYDGDSISGSSFDDLPSFVDVAERSTLERVALVSRGDASVVVFGTVHDADLEIGVFDDVNGAIEWARPDAPTRTGVDRAAEPDRGDDVPDAPSPPEHGR